MAKYRRKYTQEQRQFFIDFVPGHNYQQIADEYNKRFGDNIEPGTVKAYMCNNGLRNGLHNRFPKGHVPANKGKKMSPEQYEKCKRTMFKKGNKSENKRPIGSEYVDRYGYTWVKVSDDKCVDQKDNWRAKQRIVYEEHHGPIPEGHSIIFLDGDKTNFDIDNLYAVKQSEMIIMNNYGLRSEDPELTKTGVVVAKIKNMVKELE